MRIVIKTLGCKANRYESDKLFESLCDKHEVLELNEGAGTFMERYGIKNTDLIVVNTCTVTHVADRKSRQAIRSLKKVCPDAKVAVFGCGARVSEDEYRDMDKVDFVAADRDEILAFVDDFAIELGENHEYSNADVNRGVRTRALVKIQDGCSNYCTYCIIPHARGPEVSYPSDDILDEVQQKEAAGYKEIVLTGIIMGHYQEGDLDFAGLIRKLLDGTNSVRFRISSIEPENFSEDFFDLFMDARICPHVHMSLQSGSDSVLERMKRKYSVSDFLKIARKFKEIDPDIALTTDVIVGFPGETDNEFEETCAFVREVCFAKIHVFPYSRRRRTAAYYMDGQVSADMKKVRAAKLRKIADDLRDEFLGAMLGKVFDVLVERLEGDLCYGVTSNYIGVTSNYIPVQFNCSKGKDLINSVVKIEVCKIRDGEVFGRLAK